MPTSGVAGVGVKLVALTPTNQERGLPFINAVYVLFAAETQTPEAVIDGSALTALRTAAVSGLATRYLARPDARRLVIFGAGVQASSHVEAMLAVRSVERVVIVSRTRAHAEALVDRVRGTGVEASVGEPDAVADCDLICTCTTSATPLFDGNALLGGTHVNAVGTYLPNAREVDTATVSRAKVAVETREAALEEAGDLLIPIGEGVVGPGHVLADLKELVRGAAVRASAEDVTVFKSVGIAFEDLIVARAAVEAA
jgi:ornithine cyclodeaminase/alanine dehydrogenase-like protein (mu-crystallin family)